MCQLRVFLQHVSDSRSGSHAAGNQLLRAGDDTVNDSAPFFSGRGTTLKTNSSYSNSGLNTLTILVDTFQSLGVKSHKTLRDLFNLGLIVFCSTQGCAEPTAACFTTGWWVHCACLCVTWSSRGRSQKAGMYLAHSTRTSSCCFMDSQTSVIVAIFLVLMSPFRMGAGEVICARRHSCKPAHLSQVMKDRQIRSNPHLSRQNVRLDEGIDGRKTAVLVAGPPGADSVSFILDSCRHIYSIISPFSII